jgi:sugar lactone lactonase YvrE
VEQDRPQNRLNDGFVAPDGSLWFGSMDDCELGVSGALYRWAGGAPILKDDGYGITNGPAMSPDGRTLYHNSTLEKIVYAFDHKDGAISNKRVFATIAEGYCDGPSVDGAGVVHVGLFGGWGVDRYAPDGRRLEKIKFPCSAVTKAAFGDPDLKGLYCATAWKGQDAAARKAQPLAGALFRVGVDTPGLPQNLIKL